MRNHLTQEEIKRYCICINRSHLVTLKNGELKRIPAGEDCCGQCYPSDPGFSTCPYARMAEDIKAREEQDNK